MFKEAQNEDRITYHTTMYINKIKLKIQTKSNSPKIVKINIHITRTAYQMSEAINN